jgi:hypothetical protein
MEKRPEAFKTLKLMIDILGSQDDLLDELGQLRIIELATEQARRAVVHDARAKGITWQQLADTLAVTRQAVQQRYGQVG